MRTQILKYKVLKYLVSLPLIWLALGFAFNLHATDESIGEQYNIEHSRPPETTDKSPPKYFVEDIKKSDGYPSRGPSR